ncbi:MAG: choice-of-anchor D domain-containing protein, partial [Pirellulales bacterium]|nr:choice-of-anchor D domain-containing protein [Pirellulales bacterium]
MASLSARPGTIEQKAFVAMKFGTVVGRGAKKVKQEQRRPLRLEVLEERRLLSVVPSLVDDLTSLDPSSPYNPGGDSFQNELFTEAGGTDEIFAVGENVFFRSRYLFEQNQLYAVGAYDAPTAPVQISSDGGFQPTAVGPNVYFYEEVAGDTTLWSSDGSAASTGQVLDINDNVSFDTQSAAVNGKLIFVNADPDRGAELWSLDPAGDPPTEPFLDLRAGQSSSNPKFHGVVGNQLFFTAQTGDDQFGLWVTDGTEASEIIKDVVPVVGFDNFQSWYGKTVFLEQLGDGELVPDVLWVTDGTAANTRAIDMPTLMDDGSAAGVVNQSSLAVFNGKGFIYYAARADGADHLELWKTNGTTSWQVTNQAFTEGPANLTLVQNQLFFTAGSGDSGNELWWVDLEVGGPATLVADINAANGGDSDPSWLTPFDHHLLFVADDRTGDAAEPGTHGRELRSFDPFDSSGSAMEVIDLVRPGQDSSGVPESAFPRSLVEVAGRLFFTADDGTHGRELWVGVETDPDITVEIDPFTPIAHRQGLIDFGTVSIGETSQTQELTIKNVGGAPLTLLTTIPVRMFGDAATEFVVSRQPDQATLNPGDSTTFEIQFAPTAAGATTGTFRVISDDPNEEHYKFSVEGTGIGSLLQGPDIDLLGQGQIIASGDLEPEVADSTDYGNVFLGERVVHTFTIRNTGSDVLSLTGAEPVSVQGLNPGDFTVISQPSLTVLNPGEETTFDLEFEPLAAGQRVDAITIHSDDPDEEPYFFAVVGVGQVPGPLPDIRVVGNGLTVVHGDVEPSLDDGTAFTDASPGHPVVHTFTIENTGDATLDFVGDPPIVITGANPDDFSISLQPPASLEAGQTTTFEVQFNPTTFGVRLATVLISNSDPDEGAFQFDLQGQVNLIASSDWVSQGPGPASNGQVENILPNNPVSGAVHTVVAHPTNPNILYLGAVNGGIWKTTNATSPPVRWQPQTDLASSLSIGAMALDSSDPTSNTLVAGIGRFSNFGGLGGERSGILRTTNGGNTWTNPGSAGLEGVNISGIAVRGDQVVVASNLGGLYQSTDGGKNFSGISGDGFGVGDAFSDLVQNSKTNALFAAAPGKGIFGSADFGATWTDMGLAQVADPMANHIKLAVEEASGRLYAGVLIGGKLIGIPGEEGEYLANPGGVFYYDNGEWTGIGAANNPFPMLPLNPPSVIQDLQPTKGEEDEDMPPIIITSAGHGLISLDLVLVENEPAFAGQANGLWRVEVIDDSSFALADPMSCPFVDCMAEELELAEPAFEAENAGRWSKMEDTNPTPQLSDPELIGPLPHIPFSITVDPYDETLVYVGGERQAGPFPNRIGATQSTGVVFRGIADGVVPEGIPFLPLQWSPITHDLAAMPLREDNIPGTATTTGPFSGSRAMTIDAVGSLIEVDDGGIYKRTSPESENGDWVSLIGDLGVSEVHNVAYDTLSDTIIAGTEGGGTQYQFTSDRTEWVTLMPMEAGDVAVDTMSLAHQKRSVRYSSFRAGGFRVGDLGAAGGFASISKTTWDREGHLLSTEFPALDNLPGSPALEWQQNVTPVQLNNVNPNRMVIGGANGLYESFDQGETVSRVLAGLTTTSGYQGNPLDYGGRKDGIDNKDVIYAGAPDGSVWVRKEVMGLQTFVQTAPGGGVPEPIRDIIMNTEDYTNAFAITDSTIYSTRDMGDTWTDITGDLYQLIDSTGVKVARLLSLEFMPGLNDSAVVVGTNIGVFASLLSNPDHRWFEVGASLPNAPVWDLDFDAADDVMVVGTLGRGAWKLT